MKRKPGAPRLFAACLALAAGVAGAQSPPVAPASAAAAAPVADRPPAAADADVAALDAALAEERRVLVAGGSEFAVFVRAAKPAAAHGTLLLIPGDGTHPTAAATLERVRETLPRYGWSSWLLTLEAPPRSFTEALAPPAPPAGADTNGAAAAAPGALAVDTERAQELRRWAARSQVRIGAAITAAAADGPLVLVAGGSAAALLRGALGTGRGTVRAAALLDPVEMPGLDTGWPQDLDAPVLEVLDQATAREQGQARRDLATARGVQHYRQLVLSSVPEFPGTREEMLTRRLRGWLQTLDETLRAGTTGAD